LKISALAQIFTPIIDELLRKEVSLFTLKFGASSIIDKETLKKRFALLSFYTFEKGYIGQFPQDKIYPELTKQLQIRAEDFLLMTQLGIIYKLFEPPGKENEIIFRHQSLQEYLASLELKEIIFANGEIDQEKLIKYLEYVYWDEVWLFLIGSLDADLARKNHRAHKKV